MQKKITKYIFYAISSHFFFYENYLSPIHLHVSNEQAKKIGHQIWKNECGGKTENLLIWREEEPCISIGFYHFIWYPENSHKPHRFKETVPELFNFMKKQGKPVPKEIIDGNKVHCPWKSREDFISKRFDKKTKLLESYLLETVDLQTTFIIKRFKKAIPKIIEMAQSPAERLKFELILKKLSRSTQGIYVLVDYINFKGEGIEQCNTIGWGLVHVLREMNQFTSRLIQEFSRAAITVLERRVQNRPHEIRWLQGWRNRIGTYITFS